MDFNTKLAQTRVYATTNQLGVDSQEVYNEGILQALENLSPGPPILPYKVFTGLLTQSGGSNVQSLIDTDNGNIQIGVTYEISNYQAGDDFTNIGAPSNANGVKFIATGTTATTWQTATELIYDIGAPIVTIIENTIGNIWFEYNPFGFYYAKSIALFTANKTIVLNGGGFNQSIFYPSIVTTYYLNDNAIIVASNGDNLLSNTTFEIKVYN